MQFQDQVYGGANVHDVVFTLALPELGPDGPAALGLPPEAADVAGDGFFNGPPLPTAALVGPGDRRGRRRHPRRRPRGARRHPGALLRGLGVGLQATTRADLPVPRRGPGDPARPTGLGGDPGWSGSQAPALARGPRRHPVAGVAPDGAGAARRRRGRHSSLATPGPAAARWCLAAGLAAVTALGLVAAAVLGDGYFEVFKHVWLAAYLLVLSGLGLLGALGAWARRALGVRYLRRPGRRPDLEGSVCAVRVRDVDEEHQMDDIDQYLPPWTADLARARRQTIGTLLARTALKYGAKIAVVHRDTRRTFAELDADANRVANALAERGVVRNQRVAILSHNSYAFVVAYFALRGWARSRCR